MEGGLNMVEAVNTQGSYWGKTAKRTAITAGVAGTISAGLNYFGQKGILKNKEMYTDIYKTAIETAKESGVEKFVEKTWKSINDIIAKGKVDWKTIGKNAGKTALFFGGLYLAYRGIRALFNTTDK